MKAIINDYKDDSLELEINSAKHEVELTARYNEIDNEIFISFDKKRVVGLIQILTECLGEME